MVMQVGIGDAVLAAALAVCALLCAVSAIILARPRALTAPSRS